MSDKLSMNKQEFIELANDLNEEVDVLIETFFSELRKIYDKYPKDIFSEKDKDVLFDTENKQALKNTFKVFPNELKHLDF